MANTKELKIVSKYAIKKASEVLGVVLERKSVHIASKKSKIFDGVSTDGKIVAKVINHSGFTSGNNKPIAKIRNTFAECYFLSLTESLNRYLVMTDPEFYQIFKDESEGLLISNNIHLLLIELPSEYCDIVSRVMKQASEEMS